MSTSKDKLTRVLLGAEEEYEKQIKCGFSHNINYASGVRDGLRAAQKILDNPDAMLDYEIAALGTGLDETSSRDELLSFATRFGTDTDERLRTLAVYALWTSLYNQYGGNTENGRAAYSLKERTKKTLPEGCQW